MPSPNADVSASELSHNLEQFLAEHPGSAVLEDGRVLFEMQSARYSLSTEHGRCLLHLWSDERNLVRTVNSIELRKSSLRIETKRFGQTRPQTLQLVPDRDQRTPSTRDAARAKYLRLLERVAARSFPEYKLDSLRTAMDLEHSFGPAYARGMLLRGASAWAIIGVNAEETQETVDGILTLAVLWLAYCRQHGDGRRVFEGVRVIVPAGMAERTKARMGWMNDAIAKWQLYELDSRGEALASVDIRDSGNLGMSLVYAFDPQAAHNRSQAAVQRVLALLPERMRLQVEVCAASATEIALLLHGLEFARVRHGLAPGSFSREDRITFGAGANETELTAETEELFRDLTARLFENRQPSGTVRNPLYRLQPERWLESELRRQIADLEPSICSGIMYSQVPALSGGERGMLDLLTLTRSGRLVVFELKANEDLHLPLQALDYWMRVRQLHAGGALEQHGYFQGRELAPASPLLYLVAPALRIHPANEVVLKHLSPEIEWVMLALGEQWRKRLKVIFRKYGGGPAQA
ncbi:MAG: hypothetical protein HIU93_07535 [Acidobacteria bacterium]|nr:hypothetical protein [Acidobacteriota bacterium]MBW4046169.1 hypothetical protein [Acidobacteriota bacterium]